METHQNAYLSFGRYLREVRVEKAISLEAVSKETRIKLETLLLLENEDHAGLPAEVFVKGFIRAYAKAVGTDGDKAVELYLLSLNDYKETARFEADLMESGSKSWQKLFLSLGALVCIIAATFFVIAYTSKAGHSEKKKPQAVRAVVEHKKEVAKPPQITETLEKPTPDIPRKLLVEVLATENTWMKVVVDDRVPREYSLKTGERLKLEATSGFNFLIGNAGGIELKMNGEPVPVRGKSGQVVTIQLP